MTVVIVALCAMSGCLVGAYLRRRCKEKELYYRDLVGLCSTLIGDISFGRERLSEILIKADIKSEPLKKNVSEYLRYIGGGELKLSKNLLGDAELRPIREFFVWLGRYDGETQVLDIEHRSKEFEQKLAAIREKNAVNGNMYVKLGFLLGLLVGILLI